MGKWQEFIGLDAVFGGFVGDVDFNAHLERGQVVGALAVESVGDFGAV